MTADPQSQIQDFSESGAGVFNRQPSIDSGPLPHPNPESRPAAQSAPSPELWSVGDLRAAGRIPNPALDSCREQSTVQDQLISNCEARAELSRAAFEAAKRSTLQLGEALRAKDAMAARLEERHRAELKAARGSRLRRFGRALEYVGVGVVIGMAVAR